jgi:hypothetical protein
MDGEIAMKKFTSSVMNIRVFPRFGFYNTTLCPCLMAKHIGSEVKNIGSELNYKFYLIVERGSKFRSG